MLIWKVSKYAYNSQMGITETIEFKITKKEL